MLNIDFFEDAIRYIDSKETQPEPEAKPLIQLKETGQASRPEVLAKPEAVTEPEPRQKAYSIDINKNLITIQGQVCKIPSYYNRDMIKAGDKKTIDMVLISLGYAHLVEPEDTSKKKGQFIL